MREWLVLLGYEVVAEQRYLYCSPWSRGLSAGEGTGRICAPGLTYPLPGGAYLLKARKRIYTLTPIRPRLREKTGVHRRTGQTHDVFKLLNSPGS